MSASFNAEEILSATTHSVLESGSINDQAGRIACEVEDVNRGDWFIALPSDFYDPHNHLNIALEKGARGLIVEQNRAIIDTGNCPVISVPDTRAALLELVRDWLNLVRPGVVGVTGTSGRRATMLLLNQLVRERYKTHLAFMRDLNWAGCAREVLTMPVDTQLLIFEAGSVERGDIARIGKILQPDLAVLTSIRHPIPSPERDFLKANMYCELLETLRSEPKQRLAAVIFDQSQAVQRRTDEVLTGFASKRFSRGEASIAHRIPEHSIATLNDALSELGITASRADFWCAVEAARALGISTAELETLFELETINDVPAR